MFKYVLSSLIISTIIFCNSAFAATFNAPLLEDFTVSSDGTIIDNDYLDAFKVGGTDYSKSFLLFDISSLIINSHEKVEATLTLNLLRTLLSDTYTIGLYIIDSSLLSGTLDGDLLSSLVLNSSDLIASIQGTASDNAEELILNFELSKSEWLNLINNGATLALVLQNDSSDSLSLTMFSSLESSISPTLTLTTVPNPEPSSLILILTGSAALLAKRRKKFAA